MKRKNGGKKVSGTALYNLATAIQSEIETKSQARLNELGVDKKTVKELAPIVAKAVFGENLTLNEQSILKDSRYGIQVANELLADKSNTIWRDEKGVTSQGGVTSFVSKDGSIKTIPQITEKDGIRTIDATTIMDEDAFIEGLWEGSRKNKSDENAKNVEKGQLETFDNVSENGIIEKTVDNDTGVPGEYTEKIIWGIFNHPVRKCGKGYFGKRIKQNDLRVDNYELKINPNNESYYLQHPDGRYVQFENMKNSILQDAKLVKSKRSYYHVDRLSSFMKQELASRAKRQLETANAAGYKLEWVVSDITAVEQLIRFFAEQNMDIIVTYCPE